MHAHLISVLRHDRTLRLLTIAMAWFLPMRLGAQDKVEPAQKVVFEDYFTDQALRFEFFQCGDAKECSVVLQEIFQEPIWPENHRQMIYPFPYGKYAIKVYDEASGRLIFSRGFDTMYAEYATTSPAIEGIKRVFETTVRCPRPKNKIKVEIEHRDKQNVWSPVFSTKVDPSDYHIRSESVDQKDWTFELLKTGEPKDRVDVVFLSEGYKADEQQKFKADAQRMTDFMFASGPYRDKKECFNIRGVFRGSTEAGTDEPRQRSFKSTALNSTYNIFDLDRYLLLEDNHVMHRMAAQVPYDTIVVLVNSKRYGGGSICLDYCTSTVDHPQSEMVFLHEFGHSFAYLADEYIGAVSYNDMYPVGVEPVEPNITRETDRSKIKWKSFLTPDVPLPTIPGRSFQEAVGAFEGGGYVAKGIYRPQSRCWMGNANPTIGFCAVCQDAIKRMIEYQSQP